MNTQNCRGLFLGFSFAVLALFPSCSISPLTEFSAEKSHSIVYASSSEIADQFGSMVEESWRFLDEQLPHLESQNVILLVEEPGAERYQANHVQVSLPSVNSRDIDSGGNGARIIDLSVPLDEIESRAVVGGANTSASVEIAGLAIPFTKVSIVVLPETASSVIVTHELVHFRLSERWDALPPVLEEGLADCMSIREGTPQSEARRQLLLSSGWRMLDLNLPGNDQSIQEVYLSNPAEQIGELGSMNLYAFGWVLVHTILTREGAEGLLQLCQRAEREGFEQIPFTWAMEAAGVPASFSGFELLVETASKEGG